MKLKKVVMPWVTKTIYTITYDMQGFKYALFDTKNI